MGGLIIFFKTAVFGLLLLFSLNINTVHGEDPPLRFGFFPFHIHYLDDENQPSGSAVDLIKALASQLNIEIEYIEIPNKRMRTMMSTGELDFTIATPRYSEFNQAKVLISKNAFHDIRMMAFHTNPYVSVHTKQQLFGKKLIVRRGYDYLGWRDFIDENQNQIRISGIANSTDNALKMLKAGRGNILLEYEGNIIQALQKVPVLRLYQEELAHMPLHLIVSKKTPRAALLLKKFEKAFQDLQKQGAIDVEGHFIRKQTS